MSHEPVFVLRIGRRALIAVMVVVLVATVLLLRPDQSLAQKVQESYKEKFDIANGSGGITIATSADGKFVYLAGPQGVMVSDDHGKTGTWVQTVRLK